MSADPVQLLDRLSPPDGWNERTDLDADPVAAEILERVFAAEDTPVVSLDAERRRRRRGIGVVVVAAAVVAGGAVAALLNNSPEETRRIACWSEAAAPPEQIVALPWDGRTDPVELCAEQWAAGSFGDTTSPGDLEACVTDQSIVAVIPGGEGVCGELGLEEFDEAIPGDPVNDAQRELDLIFIPPNCETQERAERETIRVLDKYGLSGWTIRVAGTFSADEPCATVALDRDATTAFVQSRPGSI